MTTGYFISFRGIGMIMMISSSVAPSNGITFVLNQRYTSKRACFQLAQHYLDHFILVNRIIQAKQQFIRNDLNPMQLEHAISAPRQTLSNGGIQEKNLELKNEGEEGKKAK